MTIVQLEYIIAIAENGSFVEAANKCFVTQPALTTQVKNLEKELDVTIFDRTRKPIIPTEIGNQIIDQAREVLMQVKKIPDLVTEYNTDVKGDLTLGIIPTVAPYLIPKFINKYNEYWKSVNLNVVEEITEEIIFKLKNGEMDVGIIATPVDVKGVISFPLYYEKFYAYVSPNNPKYYKETLGEDDLNLSDLWLLKEGNCFRNQVINVCQRSIEEEFHNHFRYESHNIESLKRIVEVKEGMTLIPEMAAEFIPKNKKDMIKKIPSINPYREISLVVSRQFLKKRMIDSLRETIIEEMPKEMTSVPQGVIVETDVKI